MELEDWIRYVPSRAIYWYSQVPTIAELAMQLLAIFESVGWAVTQLEGAPAVDPSIEVSLDRAGLLIFVVGDNNQLSNARHAIFEFFETCGFPPIDQGKEAEVGSRELGIRFNIVVTVADVLRKKRTRTIELYWSGGDYAKRDGWLIKEMRLISNCHRRSPRSDTSN
jgi:hypothetical protein